MASELKAFYPKRPKKFCQITNIFRCPTDSEDIYSLRRADRLRQSILKKAFSGKLLVPQDEIDEQAPGLSVRGVM
ncbi:MAG: hypothetical protein DRI37_08215 [Chloroflexi bacterium]|nr:MAG: hypothetical protein DRI37_08215 [Chloroflexota bacterium]